MARLQERILRILERFPELPPATITIQGPEMGLFYEDNKE